MLRNESFVGFLGIRYDDGGDVRIVLLAGVLKPPGQGTCHIRFVGFILAGWICRPASSPRYGGTVK